MCVCVCVYGFVLHAPFKRCRHLSFRILIGGLTGCENTETGEDIVVEYRLNGDISFSELHRLNYDGRCSFKMKLISSYVCSCLSSVSKSD